MQNTKLSLEMVFICGWLLEAMQGNCNKDLIMIKLSKND